MELKDFIKNALVGIVEGVDEANESHDRFRMFGFTSHLSGVSGEVVEFDVSVVVDETKEGSKKAGAGIKVINLFTGDISAEDKKKEQNQNVNKLKFKVFVKEK